MKKLIPIKNSVVCKRTNEKSSLVLENGVYRNIENVDLYEILDFSVDDNISFNFKIGDIIMSNSTGDEIEINKLDVVFLFKVENIMCKVIENERI